MSGPTGLTFRSRRDRIDHGGLSRIDHLETTITRSTVEESPSDERGRAFADNPAWARCYCHFFHVAPVLDWESLSAGANRTAIGARIATGEMEGFLAYDRDGSVAGWLNAQPRHKLPHCFARLDIEAAPIEVPPILLKR